MRVAILTLVAMALAVPAFADDPSCLRLPVNTPGVDPGRDLFYCQDPWILSVVNASSAYDAELCDDIPSNLYCHYISQIDVIIGQWSTGAWTEPAGIWVHFYDGQCPPPLEPFLSQYHPWDTLGDVWLYDSDPGYPWYGYWITIWKCPPVHISDNMSIGFQVETTWGQNAPYCGIWTTYTEMYGACGAYWDGEYWGAPRWTYGLDYFGYYADVCMCFGENQGPSGADSESWSTIKSLYK